MPFQSCSAQTQTLSVSYNSNRNWQSVLIFFVICFPMKENKGGWRSFSRVALGTGRYWNAVMCRRRKSHVNPWNREVGFRLNFSLGFKLSYCQCAIVFVSCSLTKLYIPRFERTKSFTRLITRCQSTFKRRHYVIVIGWCTSLRALELKQLCKAPS